MLLVILSHAVIDMAKAYLQNEKNNRLLFFSDQLLHLLAIVVAVRLYYPLSLDLEILFGQKVLLLIASFLFVTVVSAVIMKVIIQKWHTTGLIENESLENAGKYIGMLERSFVLLFIILNYWSGIGFLLAAKSVFRFGDLTNKKDRALIPIVV
jgi:hypothetical protein